MYSRFNLDYTVPGGLSPRYETRATVQNLIRDELYMNIPDSIPPQQIQFMITLTIISFSSGLDSAIMMVRATKVWSSRVLLPSVS